MLRSACIKSKLNNGSIGHSYRHRWFSAVTAVARYSFQGIMPLLGTLRDLHVANDIAVPIVQRSFGVAAGVTVGQQSVLPFASYGTAQLHVTVVYSAV